MKIAVDIREASKEKTGKGWYTLNLIQEILKLDSGNQYFLYTNVKNQLFDNFKNATVKVIKTSSFRWHFHVLKDIKAENADLFFAPTSYIIPAFAPKTLKTVITVHDLVAFLFPSTHNRKAILIERLTLRKALRKTKAVLAVSENTKKDILQRFHYPEEKIFLTPCAASEFFKTHLEATEVEGIKEKLHLPEHFILAVGTLEPRKNFSTLIKSFVIVKRKHPDYKLVIVGKKGWKYTNIENTLQKYHLEKDVIFPGYLEDKDLQKVYSLAKVFVFPSLYEGFGIPPLEAMCSGCPVVSSNVASLPEVIGDSGLLIDPKNAYKMADAISSLLTNTQLRNMFIERGWHQAQKFSWVESAKKALEVFNSLHHVDSSPEKKD